MIERIIEQREPIRLVWAVIKLVPTWQDLDSIVVVLKPLQHFIDLLTGEKRGTVSSVIPLLSHVLAYNEGDTDLTDEMKSRITVYE